MVAITVVMITKRKEPHIDWYLESLVEQTFPYNGFECILVDGFWKERKEKVAGMIRDIVGDKFSVLHIPDKPSRWKGKRPCVSNARNTGLIFANGKYIVHADDNCKMPENWLESYYRWLDKGYIIAGNWYSNISGWEYRSTVMKNAGFVGGGWLYGANMGFPLEVALDVNCFDELYDGELGQDDLDMGIRAERRNYRVMYDPSCYVCYNYTDHGLLMTSDKDVHNDFWKKNIENGNINAGIEINVVPVNIKLKDGLEHFSNEFLIQELLDDKERYLPRGNTIQIRGTREIFGTGNGFGNWKYSIEEMYKMMESWVDDNKYDWRDGKLVSEKIEEKLNEMK